MKAKRSNKQNDLREETSIAQRFSQSDMPAYTLNEAFRVVRALADNYAAKSTRPLAVAQAMQMAPTTGKFRMLCGASIAYGLTSGGYNSNLITPTPLGLKIVKPLKEGDDVVGLREALLKPRIIREFLTQYDGSKVPKLQIALNVLESMGVPSTSSQRTFDIIMSSSRALGFLTEIKGDLFVDLKSAQSISEIETEEFDEETETAPAEEHSVLKFASSDTQRNVKIAPLGTSNQSKRIFITHGKNRNLVPQLSEFLKYAGFEPIVAVERETLSKPVSEKVLDDMRSCIGAVMHIDAERELFTKDGQSEIVLNPNVLLEIGAAQALYRGRFILLVQNGVKLPSNLHGLYEVRYSGDALDADAVLKILKAFNDFKVVTTRDFHSDLNAALDC